MTDKDKEKSEQKHDPKAEIQRLKEEAEKRYNSQDYQKAIDIFHQALDIAQQHDYQDEVRFLRGAISRVQFDFQQQMCEAYYLDENWQQAEDCYNKLLNRTHDLLNREQLVKKLILIKFKQGKAFLEDLEEKKVQKQWPEALVCYTEAYQLAKQTLKDKHIIQCLEIICLHINFQERQSHHQYQEAMKFLRDIEANLPIGPNQQFDEISKILFDQVTEIEDEIREQKDKILERLDKHMIDLYKKGKEAYHLEHWWEAKTYLEEVKRIDDEYIYNTIYDRVLDLTEILVKAKKKYVRQRGMQILERVFIDVLILTLLVTAFQNILVAWGDSIVAQMNALLKGEVIERIEVKRNGQSLTRNEKAFYEYGPYPIQKDDVDVFEIIVYDANGKKYVGEQLACQWTIYPLDDYNNDMTGVCKTQYIPAKEHPGQFINFNIVDERFSSQPSGTIIVEIK